MLSCSTYEIPLRPTWKALALLTAATLLASFLAARAIKIAVIEACANSNSLAKIQSALAMDPDNPELLANQGLIYYYNLEAMNPQAALQSLRRAVDLSPYRTTYWMALGSACELAQDLACADRAVERAQSLSPTTPRVQWWIANYYLRTNRVEAGLRAFRRILEMNQSYAPTVFRLALQAVDDPQEVFRQLFPSGSDPYEQAWFVDFLAEQGQVDLAYQLWSRVQARPGGRFDVNAAQPLLEGLISRGKVAEAWQVWLELERVGIVPKPSPANSDNLIYNGGFEQPPLNAGFDWYWRKAPFISTDVRDSEAYEGAACVRVDFTANSNEDFELLYQTVRLAPNQSYRLQAFLRTQDITSDSGPRLEVVDPECPKCLDVFSETTTGTTPWHAVLLDFAAGAQTRFVRIVVRRIRSRVFPTEITGTFWLDAVSLKSVQEASSAGGPQP